MSGRTRSIPSTIAHFGINRRPETSAHTSLRKKTLTQAQLTDFAAVARELNELRDDLARVTLAARVSPLMQANLLRRVSFTSGTAIDLEHMLDRVWSEFVVVGQIGAFLTARAIYIDDAHAKRFLRLVPDATGVASAVTNGRAPCVQVGSSCIRMHCIPRRGGYGVWPWAAPVRSRTSESRPTSRPTRA
jgi:hypothetical protein